METYTDLLKDYTCLVQIEGETVFTSTAIGVKPLLDYYGTYGRSQKPLTVIDRIMGKGAVVLAVLCGAKSIITPVMSEAAYAYALKAGLEVTTDKQVPMIINRQGDGRCPVETAVLDIDDVLEGYQAIVKTLENLRNSSK